MAPPPPPTPPRRRGRGRRRRGGGRRTTRGRISSRWSFLGLGFWDAARGAASEEEGRARGRELLWRPWPRRLTPIYSEALERERVTRYPFLNGSGLKGRVETRNSILKQSDPQHLLPSNVCNCKYLIEYKFKKNKKKGENSIRNYI